MNYIFIYFVVSIFCYELVGRYEGKGSWLPFKRFKEIINKKQYNFTLIRYILLLLFMPLLIFSYIIIKTVNYLDNVTKIKEE